MDDFGDIIPPLGVKIISASEITLNDVLSGRGGSINTNPGNERYRRLVESKKRLYLTARFKREKRLIASNIVAEILALNPPGRFLTKIPDPCKSNKGKKGAQALAWYEVDLEKARDKTSQALREGAPVIRQEMEDERVQFVAATTTATGKQYEEDDYEDMAAFGGEDNFNNNQDNANNTNNSWIPSLDVLMTSSSPWDSFRNLAATVAYPYFGTTTTMNNTHEDEQAAAASQLRPSRAPHHLQQHASHDHIPTNTSPGMTMTSKHRNPEVGYGASSKMTEDRYHPRDTFGYDTCYSSDYPSSSQRPPPEATGYYWRASHSPDHPSMPPPPPESQQKYQDMYYCDENHYHQSTPSSAGAPVLVIPAVTPESPMFRRASGIDSSPYQIMQGPNFPDQHHRKTGVGSLNYHDQRKHLQIGSNEEKKRGESIRTLDSGYIQTRQSWESEIDIGNVILFDSDVDMENADNKGNLRTSEQREDVNTGKAPWSNLESWLSCVNNSNFDLIAQAHTLCSVGYDNFSVDSPLGGPSLCNVFNEHDQQLSPSAYSYDDTPAITHIVAPAPLPPLYSSNNDEEIEIHVGRRRALSALSLKSLDDNKSSSFGNNSNSGYFGLSDKSLNLMDFPIPHSPLNSIINNSSFDEPMYDFGRVWKAGSRDQ